MTTVSICFNGTMLFNICVVKQHGFPYLGT